MICSSLRYFHVHHTTRAVWKILIYPLYNIYPCCVKQLYSWFYAYMQVNGPVVRWLVRFMLLDFHNFELGLEQSEGLDRDSP